jgi:hypothetical protein
VTSPHGADPASAPSAAYKAGKEPPSVTKARLRHQRGGGARTASGRPKVPGAFRLLLASRLANACMAAQQRGDHKAARRRAWYDEIAPVKDPVAGTAAAPAGEVRRRTP